MKIHTTGGVRLDVSLSKKEAGILAIMISSLDWEKLEEDGYGTNSEWGKLATFLESHGDEDLVNVVHDDFSEYHRIHEYAHTMTPEFGAAHGPCWGVIH